MSIANREAIPAPEFVEDEGQMSGSSLTTDDKKAPIAYVKTL